LVALSLEGTRTRPVRLPIGAYALGVSEAQGGRVACQEFPFEIRAGEPTELTAAIGTGAPIDLRFLQLSGEEWASWVDTTIRDAVGVVVYHAWLGRGNGDWPGELTSLGPGRYTIEAESDVGTKASATIDVKGDAADTQVFEIRLLPPSDGGKR